jgi:hypothetical protein
MHIRAGYLGAALALFTVAVPVWAHTDTAKFTVLNKAEIGTTELRPGTYKLEVLDNANQVKVVDRDTGKTIAEVPCHWITLNRKPMNTEVMMNSDRVTEIAFHGTTQAVRVG